MSQDRVRFAPCCDCGTPVERYCAVANYNGPNRTLQYQCINCYAAQYPELDGPNSEHACELIGAMVEECWQLISSKIGESHDLALKRFRGNDQQYVTLHDTIGKAKYQPGYVYLVRAENGLYKIGRTNKVDERFKSIDLLVPFEIQLVHIIRTDSAPFCETYFHRLYDHRRVKGEWFALGAYDVLNMAQHSELNYLEREWRPQRSKILLECLDEVKRLEAEKSQSGE